MTKFSLIKLPIYNIDFAVSVNQDDKSFKKSIYSIWEIPEEDFFGKLPPYAGAITLYTDLGGLTTPYCIRFKGRPKLKDATVAHEALHVTNRILQTRGILLSRDTEEAYCYLLGHIVREINKRL